MSQKEIKQELSKEAKFALACFMNGYMVAVGSIFNSGHDAGEALVELLTTYNGSEMEVTKHIYSDWKLSNDELDAARQFLTEYIRPIVFK